MQRFIRYLYEYEQRRRARNAGFVKVEEGTDRCTIHIHAKGLKLDETKNMELFLLVETGRGIEKIPQGRIQSSDPTMNVKFVYGREDLPNEDMYDHVGGVLLEDGTKRRYMATWEGVQAEAGQIPTYRPDYMPETSMQEEPVSEEPIQEESRSEESRSEEPGPEEPRSEEPISEGMIPKEQVSEEPIEIAMGSPAQMVEELSSVVRSEGVFDNGEKRTVVKHKCRAEKIQRNDLVKLARCEWQLANNRFLLHGYYNYHHLVFIEDGKQVLLGVPGIFHEKEAAAAEGYGFGTFVANEELDMRSDLNEPVDEENFGYWTRPVKRIRVENMY